ncbi:MAG: Ig-like domain-containing protein [Anaerolineae bacterium]|nr:Ig-like domain-containing protein [Anaerolineae bacterium]
MNKRIGSVMAIVFLVAVQILAACQVAPTATPVALRQSTPPELPGERAATVPPEAAAPTRPAVAAAPSPVPTATLVPTPLPPQPPRLLSRSPARGEELAVDGQVVLVFDQAMDSDSTEAAFQIAPAVEGQLSWDDASTLRFTPLAGALSRDAVYQISVAETAESAAGLPLARPVELELRTVGYLEVTQVFPAPDAEDVSTTGVQVRAFFNRPVVPLTGLQQAEGLPDPITFSPPIEGQGQWLNSSIYTFQPSEPLAPGVRYTAEIAAGLDDTTGGVLAEDYAWSFLTELPRVTAIEPVDGARYVDPATSIRLTFNTDMDRAATQVLFALLPDDAETAVSGTFVWDEHTLVFEPGQPLELGAAYRIRLDPGAPTADREAAILAPQTWRFTVAPRPAVTAIQPKDGATAVELWGGLEIRFSSPISTETLLEGLSITPTVDLYPYWSDDDTRVQLSTYLRPSTVYTLTVGEGILGRYGHALRQEMETHFETAPLDPMVQLQVPGTVGTYNAYSDLPLAVTYRNVSRVDLELYEMPREDFIALNREDFWEAWEKYAPERANRVRVWSQEVEAPLNAQGVYSTSLRAEDGSALSPGFYYLAASAPGVQYTQRHMLVVSPLNMTLKAAAREALIWVTDLRTGRPIADLPLAVYDAKAKLVAEVETDEDGVALTEIPQQDPWAPLTVLSQDAERVGAVVRSWQRGVEPYAFGFPVSPMSEPQRLFFYTDRRIYRPGQTVYFKGVVRLDDDGRYSLPPAGTSVTMIAIDVQGREVWREDLSLNEMGTIAGEFALSEDAALGYYRLHTTYGSAEDVGYYPFGTDFQVAEYRAPEFQVALSLDQDEYLAGDTMQASLEATYFFGGPVAEADVTWRVMRRNYYFDRWEGQGYYSFSDDPEEPGRPTDFDEFITEGRGTTDAQGRLTFEVPADLADRRLSQVYTVEASVVDLDNQEVTARAGAIVHKGELYIGLGATRYVGTAGQEQTVRVISVDTQGITRTQQTAEVVFYKHEWYSVRERADNGAYYWTNKVRDTAVATRTVRTDDRGVALARFTPSEGGTYKVLASTLDRYENEVRSALYLWISGEAYINWGQEDNDRIELVADQKSYQPGDIAQILIPSPFQEATLALMTVERGGILEHRLLEIESNSSQLQLPILPEYAPNVYLSVVLIRGMAPDGALPAVKVGYVQIPVSTERHELQVTITPDRDGPYAPRDQATFDIQARDYRGRGVVAEISLQLVDLAVETLVGGEAPDIVEAFYRERPLGVITAATLAMSVDRVSLETVEGGKGGGGGGPEGAREYFPDTAFWAPSVVTDESGEASVTVDLPDSLTTWRMTAQAVTADTQVGRARADVVTTLDLLIRPVTPRFMVIGDQPVLGAIVHNNTSRALDVQVSLTANGVELERGEPFEIAVPAGGRGTVSWPTQVMAADEAELTFSAAAAGLQDAVILRLPVYHPSYPEVVGTAGQVEDRVIEVVRLPQDVDPSMGELTVNLEPSLAASMREGLRYLRAYPYDCIEQAVSRFLPNLAVYRALQKLGLERPEWQAALPQQIGLSMQRIYALQNLDGGWGWWAGQESSPELTAYVVLGLSQAKAAGFAVDGNVLDRGLSYLYEWLDLDMEDTRAYRDRRASVLYALAEAGRGDLGRSVALYDDGGSLSLYAKAYLAMALRLLDPDETSRPQALANELMDAALLSATGMHWEEAERSPWAMNTDTRTTAIVLRALLRVQPEASDGVLPNVVRWLMLARRSGRWETTQENVWAILALTDFMVSTGELAGEYDYALTINGETEAQGQVTAANLEEVVEALVPMGALRVEDDNYVIIERSQPQGELYYSAFLRYFLPAEQVTALNRGIIVQREYTLADDPQRPLSEVRENDIVTVKLTLIAPHDLYYLVVEDPLPAGTEAIDPSLATTRSGASRPDLERSAEEGQAIPPYWDWYRYWPSHTELRDDKVALFTSHLPRGTYEYSYDLRCTTPGRFQVLPATAYEMYTPDVFGRSAGAALEIGAAD